MIHFEVGGVMIMLTTIALPFVLEHACPPLQPNLGSFTPNQFRFVSLTNKFHK
jgi:hypothetical protein